MRGRNAKGTFIKKPRLLPTLEERLDRLGVSYYEWAVLKLVIAQGFEPSVAVEAVRRKYGVTVDVNALYRKLNPIDSTTQ